PCSTRRLISVTACTPPKLLKTRSISSIAIPAVPPFRLPGSRSCCPGGRSSCPGGRPPLLRICWSCLGALRKPGVLTAVRLGEVRPAPPKEKVPAKLGPPQGAQRAVDHHEPQAKCQADVAQT